MEEAIQTYGINYVNETITTIVWNSSNPLTYENLHGITNPNLAGVISFKAQNVQVPATETKVTALADSSIVMIAAMQQQDRSTAVWALNMGEVRGQNFEGSVFEHDYREVRPFQAYTVHRQDNSSPAPRYIPLIETGGTTGIEVINQEKLTMNYWYDLEGRRLQGKPTQKGIYIQNGKKVVIQ